MALRACLGRFSIHRSCASNNKSRYLNSSSRKMCTTQLSDFEHQIMTVKLEIEKCEKMRNQILKVLKEHKKNIDALNSTIKMKKLVESENIVEYDFKTLKFEYKDGWLWLKNIHEAAHSIEGGTDFIKNFEEGYFLMMNDIFYYSLSGYSLIMNSEIGKKIVDHPLVQSNGHSEGRVLWAFYKLQSLYRNGWKK
jgi:hypothetical protein